MDKKIIIAAVLLVAIVLILAIYILLIWGPMDCQDGKGNNYYFEKKELIKSTQDINKFYPSNEIDVIAMSQQNCSILKYEVKSNGKLTETDYKKFEEFLKNYNQNCNDCLLVYKIGWPYFGEIYKVSTNQLICGTGHRTDENCIKKEEL